MMKSNYRLALILFALFPAFTWASEKPNVIVIMADDLGAEGLNCYGSTIYTTPHLDKMAAEGARFNNAYATPLCTPTRVMIMSGLYPNRTGYTALMGKSAGTRLPASIRTFGHDFKTSGYKTAIAGKWQLGKFDEFPNQPVEHGFDEYCMWTWFHGGKKHSRFYQPAYYTDGKVHYGTENDFGPDIYSKFVLDFIDRNMDVPFCIYYPMALVHSPFIHPPRLEDLARTKFNDNVDKQTAAFGHMITYMDDIVGQIRAKLEEHDLADNTLILFTADNGTHKAITSQLPGMQLKGGKGSMIEAGTRVPFIAWWPGQIKPTVKEDFLCLVDVLPTICSIAKIDLKRKVDGMDLSHSLLGTKGTARDHIFMAYKGGQFFTRDRQFRLSLGGKKESEENLFHIPVRSDTERYRESVSTNPEHQADRQRLKKLLDQYTSIPDEYAETRKAASGKK